MTVPCSHGMPTPAACVECMEDGNLAPPAPEPRLTGRSAPFQASYAGQCSGCNLPISPGQWIVGLGGVDTVVYVHDGCEP